ncbi:MAG TPA: hypothetical protein VGS28_03870 [Candidatus Saccharimonadales bacterium]|nr:hypothetical protein [Candidatus Saccharimonadales bacterium]
MGLLILLALVIANVVYFTEFHHTNTSKTITPSSKTSKQVASTSTKTPQQTSPKSTTSTRTAKTQPKSSTPTQKAPSSSQTSKQSTPTPAPSSSQPQTGAQSNQTILPTTGFNVGSAVLGFFAVGTAVYLVERLRQQRQYQ